MLQDRNLFLHIPPILPAYRIQHIGNLRLDFRNIKDLILFFRTRLRQSTLVWKAKTAYIYIQNGVLLCNFFLICYIRYNVVFLQNLLNAIFYHVLF